MTNLRKAPPLTVPKPTVSIFAGSESCNEFPRLTVYGPPEHGKSFFACSGSVHWPANIEAGTKAVLSDVAYIGIDRNALSGLLQYNISVPNFINVPKLLTPLRKGDKDRPVAAHILQALDMIYKELASCVVAGECTIVVADTISMLAKLVDAYWTQNAPISRKTGQVDEWGRQDLILETHMMFHSCLDRLPATVVYLSHAKYTDSSQQDATKKAASQTPGLFEVQPELPPRISNLYLGNVDVEGTLFATASPDGKTFTRKFHPRGGKNFRGKNRLQKWLKSEMAPDLRAILTTIQGKGK